MPEELTDAQIIERFGDLFEEASTAFRSDVTYLLEMADAAGARRHRRDMSREAKRLRKTDTKT